MGCGCNSNFSGGSRFASNRYKPYLTSGRKLNAAGAMGCPSGCSPCLIGGGCCEGGYGDGAKCRGAARQGRKPKQNLDQRIKSNKAKFSSFMGYAQNFPKVDTKKYGISDEHYYEFNSPSNVRTGINYNDIDVSF